MCVFNNKMRKNICKNVKCIGLYYLSSGTLEWKILSSGHHMIFIQIDIYSFHPVVKKKLPVN